jgi:RNA polymerase-binding transcription factor
MAAESVKPQLDATTLTELRRRLEDEAARLQGMLRASATPNQGNGVHDPLAIDPEDYGDMAQDITTADTEMALSANDQRLLAQVRHALQRMDAGLYGLSDVSGKPIPLERLQALPWATTNVEDGHRNPTQ